MMPSIGWFTLRCAVLLEYRSEQLPGLIASTKVRQCSRTLEHGAVCFLVLRAQRAQQNLAALAQVAECFTRPALCQQRNPPFDKKDSGCGGIWGNSAQENSTGPLPVCSGCLEIASEVLEPGKVSQEVADHRAIRSKYRSGIVHGLLNLLDSIRKSPRSCEC